MSTQTVFPFSVHGYGTFKHSLISECYDKTFFKQRQDVLLHVSFFPDPSYPTRQEQLNFIPSLYGSLSSHLPLNLSQSSNSSRHSLMSDKGTHEYSTFVETNFYTLHHYPSYIHLYSNMTSGVLLCFRRLVQRGILRFEYHTMCSCWSRELLFLKTTACIRL